MGNKQGGDGGRPPAPGVAAPTATELTAAPPPLATRAPSSDDIRVSAAEAKREFEELRERYAGDDGRPLAPLTEQIVNEWFPTRFQGGRLPYVLQKASYGKTSAFNEAWVVTNRIGDDGAYGSTYGCFQRKDEDFDGKPLPRVDWMYAERARRELHYAALGELCAVKKLRKKFTTSEADNVRTDELRKKFAKFWHAQLGREVHLLYLLQRTSKYMARLTAAYEDDDMLYIVMPRMHGSLKDAWHVLNAEERKTVGLRVVHEMLWALLELKRLKWVHGDLQLKNICVWAPLTHEHGHIGIVDFGLAQYLGDKDFVELPEFYDIRAFPPGLDDGRVRSYAFDVALVGQCITELLGAKSWDAIKDPALKNMLQGMRNPDRTLRPTVEQCLNDYGLFPEVKEDPGTDGEVNKYPLDGMRYDPRFNAHYEPHDDFAGGGEEEWDEGSASGSYDSDDERGRRYEDALARRRAECLEERERLLADNRALRRELKRVAKLVKKAKRVARR